MTVAVDVPAADRRVLESWLRSTSMPAGPVRRARIVLLAADGVGTNEIATRTGASKPTVIGWKKRYAAEGLARYKRPEHIEVVAEIPRNSMGKILKDQLRADVTPH